MIDCYKLCDECGLLFVIKDVVIVKMFFVVCGVGFKLVMG